MLKKAEMAYGGMSGGKKHMYAAGGSVDDNPGLKEYINENCGASDAVGWLMHEI